MDFNNIFLNIVLFGKYYFNNKDHYEIIEKSKKKIEDDYNKIKNITIDYKMLNNEYKITEEYYKNNYYENNNYENILHKENIDIYKKLNYNGKNEFYFILKSFNYYKYYFNNLDILDNDDKILLNFINNNIIKNINDKFKIKL